MTPTEGDVVGAVVAAHRGLIDQTRTTEPPSVERTQRPAWQGVGPYGHGGSGMTDGTPFGRPLPNRADDLRDGLKLDALSVVVSPFFPAFPVGLTLEVVVQGDLVQQVAVRDNPFAATAGSTIDVFEQAATLPVPLATLELTRAAHHLRAMARTLRLLDLDGFATRVLRSATAAPEDLRAAIPGMLRLLRRIPISRSLPPAGVVDDVAPVGHGFLARSAGRAVDARAEDPAYAGLDIDSLDLDLRRPVRAVRAPATALTP